MAVNSVHFQNTLHAGSVLQIRSLLSYGKPEIQTLGADLLASYIKAQVRSYLDF